MARSEAKSGRARKKAKALEPREKPKSVKPKKRCCTSNPRCKRCPVVLKRLEGEGYAVKDAKQYVFAFKVPKKRLKAARAR